MRNWILVIFTGLLFTCNNVEKSEALPNIDLMEETEALEPTAAEELSSIAINYDMLIEDKLKEYAELVTLQYQHPEFETSLKQQLKALARERLFNESGEALIKIIAINPLTETETLNDSVQKMQFSFSYKTDERLEQDTLVAIFTSREVMIDNLSRTTVKVTFEQPQKSGKIL